MATAWSLVGCSVDARILKKKRATTGGDGLSEFVDGGVFGTLPDGGDDADTGNGGTGSGAGGSGNGSGGNHPGGGSGGAFGGGGTSSGGAGDGSGGDQNGSGGAFVQGCLDSNPPEGCQGTLVQNSTFADESNWTAEPDVTQTWSTKDSTNTSGSGSLSVKNTVYIDVSGTGLAGSTQCIDVSADTTYLVGANVYIAPGQGAGSAAISTWVYDVPGCTGRSSLTGLSVLAGAVDAWTPTLGAIHTTFDAKSMLVRLVAVKPYKLNAFEVLFDDVRVYPAPAP
ncbi:MAG TPA: hypothetical protein VHE30_04850 [Polyangiaceae bacterium]|nr:hypothetical protein [Polyangiaceae bacterium]